MTASKIIAKNCVAKCRVTRQTQLNQLDGSPHLVVVDIDIALGDGHAAMASNIKYIQLCEFIKSHNIHFYLVIHSLW